MMQNKQQIAILYQANPAPAIDGIIKPLKPGGYSDSGADIAYELIQHPYAVCTPSESPSIVHDLDWVFPDTQEGIGRAIQMGTTTLWLNTVLYAAHPILHFSNLGLHFIGQHPAMVEKFDNKFRTNQYLKNLGLPVAKMQRIALDQEDLDIDFEYPIVVKPIRGRGSQGVRRIDSKAALLAYLAEFKTSGLYGSAVYVEPFLAGKEITITVMPAGTYVIDQQTSIKDAPWCLPPVQRFGHADGIAPYNGTVAVMQNSAVLSEVAQQHPTIEKAMMDCVQAAKLIGIKAPICIDCRADVDGNYFLFDLNLKPNMTGPSRPHRKNQDSLTLMAARAMGWDYIDLLSNMVSLAWPM